LSQCSGQGGRGPFIAPNKRFAALFASQIKDVMNCGTNGASMAVNGFEAQRHGGTFAAPASSTVFRVGPLIAINRVGKGSKSSHSAREELF
jgi:hypothetical protein